MKNPPQQLYVATYYLEGHGKLVNLTGPKIRVGENLETLKLGLKDTKNLTFRDVHFFTYSLDK